MSKDYSKVIEELLKKQNSVPKEGEEEKDEDAPIFNDEIVENATKRIKTRLNVGLSDEIFVRLAAINLFDACTKHPKYKKGISKKYVKDEATFLLRLLVTNNVSQDIVRYYFNEQQDVAYFQLYGITFFYNHIKKSDITAKASANPPIEWPGYKARTMALEIFDLATK